MERKFTETQVNQIVKDAVAPLQAEIERLKSEMDSEPDGSRKELMEEVQRLSQQNQELSAIESAHQQVEASLQAALADTQRKTLENDALIRASRAVLRHKRFPEAAKTIFECCKEMTGATAGYVALLSEDGSENEVLFLDSGGRKCTVAPNLPMPIRGLRATAYHQAMTVYDNDFWNSHWKQFLPGGHVPLDNVMFAPLTIDNQVVGLIGLGNKNGPFTENDSRMATAFGELAAIALKNSRALEALEQANEAARAATQAKSEFLANMSHEIRTPMTAILGFADLLLDDPQLQKALPESLEAVQTIQNNGNYLLQLINDILDLSKIEAGKLKMERTQSSPHHLLGEVASLMRSRAREKNLFLKMEFLGEIPETIHTDPVRVRQILINLVGNAIKFTEEGGVRIQTRWNEEQQALQFEVIDTGIGISESQLNTLFQAFSQADPSTTRKFGGTGLGLNISKKMAEQLGGSITVTSVPGQGSSFSLFLPTGPREELVLVKGLREGRNISRTESLKEQNLPRLDCKVLVAEDGQDNQRLIRLILEKAGAKVEVAENGKEAIEKVFAAIEADQMFDTILMDIQMPVIDGFSATRKLREAGYTGVIIALTANAMEGAKEKCLECGCDAYVSKPITRDSFLKTIAANLPPEDVPSSPME